MVAVVSARIDWGFLASDWDAVVVGMARHQTRGWPVTAIHLDHHASVHAAANRIEAQAVEDFRLEKALLVHRIGSVRSGDPIVACAANAPDPSLATGAARWMLEATKSRLPLWKLESGPLGKRWVQGQAWQEEETNRA